MHEVFSIITGLGISFCNLKKSSSSRYGVFFNHLDCKSVEDAFFLQKEK